MKRRETLAGQQCSAVLEKYRILSVELRRTVETALLVTSELEYLLMAVRSVYDLLQKVAKEAGNLIMRTDSPAERLMATLPDSFAKVVLKGDEILTQDAISALFRLPDPLAAFYAGQAGTFRRIRALRDGIAHHGTDLPYSFAFDEGMAVPIDELPWKDFPIWQSAPLIRERFGPLRSVFAHVISKCLSATSEFAGALSKFVKLPVPVAEGVKVFIRDPYMHHLAQLEDTIQSPWEGKTTGHS
jgi:hypothetical protein